MSTDLVSCSGLFHVDTKFFVSDIGTVPPSLETVHEKYHHEKGDPVETYFHGKDEVDFFVPF